MRVFLSILFFAVVGVCAALTVSPKFCYFWQDTPILQNIYAWVDANFKPFILVVTKSQLRDIYLAILGVILISIVVFGLFKVRPLSEKDVKYVSVTATPVIDNKGETTVVVVEEN